MSTLPHIDWPWSQVRRYLGGYSCLDRCSSGHTYERWCLLRTKTSKQAQRESADVDTAAQEGGEDTAREDARSPDAYWLAHIETCRECREQYGNTPPLLVFHAQEGREKQDGTGAGTGLRAPVLGEQRVYDEGHPLHDLWLRIWTARREVRSVDSWYAGVFFAASQVANYHLLAQDAAQPSDPRIVERACEVMHDAYERAAVGAGWETNVQSRKPWADVPEANKATMRAAVSALLDHLRAAGPLGEDAGLRERIKALQTEMLEWVDGRRSTWNQFCGLTGNRAEEIAQCAIADAHEVVKLSAAIVALRTEPGTAAAREGGEHG
jgi:hypothetical protein